MFERCTKSIEGRLAKRLLPHPIVAPVALPAGQPALAELQKQSVLLVKQSAAADVAEREEDFFARSAPDIIERGAERAGSLLLDSVSVKGGG
jgi:hypothetical protein